MFLFGQAVFALHATPFFVFPIFFPAGPFGGIGLSLLKKKKKIQGGSGEWALERETLWIMR